MTFRPVDHGFVPVWDRGALEHRWYDVVYQGGGGSSRRCKLHSTLDTKTEVPHLHREGRLKPCRAVLSKVDVCYATHNGLEETVVLLQCWRKGARCGPEVVKELWEGKGMLQKKDGVMGREVLETFTHPLQHGNLDLRMSVMDTVTDRRS